MSALRSVARWVIEAQHLKHNNDLPETRGDKRFLSEAPAFFVGAALVVGVLIRLSFGIRDAGTLFG